MSTVLNINYIEGEKARLESRGVRLREVKIHPSCLHFIYPGWTSPRTDGRRGFVWRGIGFLVTKEGLRPPEA